MKKKVTLISIILLITVCLMTVGTIIVFNKNKKVTDKIIKYCNIIEDSQFEIKLSDFTDFEWDNVIIYKVPATNKEIEEITGIHYDKTIDLQSGMIFIRDGNVVYEEVFKTDFETPYNFVIFPYEDINSKMNINQFEKDNAIFYGEKIKHNNENRYALTPIKFNSKMAYTEKQLADMALDYFIKHNTDILSKEMYHVGGSEDVIDQYKNKDMVVIEIRHINDNINNALDARYYINIYTAKGFDMSENEIDFNALE